MSSIHQNGFSIAGYVQNRNESGFTIEDCIKEMIDNSLDWGSGEIKIHIDTNEKKIIFADNGVGIPMKDMEKAHVICDRKNVNENRNGMFGVGGSTARINLSGQQHLCTTISKCGCDHSEVNIDWSAVVKTGILNISPHDISVKSMAQWNKYAINCDSNGSMFIINSNPEIINKISEDMESYKLGHTYFKYLQKGITIVVIIDKKILNIKADDPNLLGSTCEKTTIEVWHKTPDYEFYFKNGNGVMAVLLEDGSQDTLSYPPQGYKHESSLTATSIYNDQFDEDGYRSFMRGDRIIDDFKFPTPISGDFCNRKIKSRSRQIVELNISAITNTILGIQTNKSDINQVSINPKLLKTLDHHHIKFYRKICNVAAKTKVSKTAANEPIQQAKVTVAKAPAQESKAPAQESKAPLATTCLITSVHPFPSPMQPHSFTFSIDEQRIIVVNNGITITSVICFAQPENMISEYKAILVRVGPNRFNEIIIDESVSRAGWSIN